MDASAVETIRRTSPTRSTPTADSSRPRSSTVHTLDRIRDAHEQIAELRDQRITPLEEELRELTEELEELRERLEGLDGGMYGEGPEALAKKVEQNAETAHKAHTKAHSNENSLERLFSRCRRIIRRLDGPPLAVKKNRERIEALENEVLA